MGNSLRFLVIEDSDTDFQLHRRNLASHGVAADLHRVDSMAGLEAALTDTGWDAVISDYCLPGLDFLEVLAKVKKDLPDVPIILASGSVGEEAAVDLLKQGVWDFVWKDRPARLSQAIIHCLEEARTRNARRRAEIALRTSESRYRSLFEHMLGGYASCRIVLEDGVPVDWMYLDVNPAFERLTGLHDVVGRRVSEIVPGIHADTPALVQVYGRVAATGVPERMEHFVERLGIWLSTSVYSTAPGEFVSLFDNITERKTSEHNLQEAMSRLAMAISAGHYGVWDLDLRSGGLLLDDRLCRIFGLERGGYSGLAEAWTDLIHPEDKNRVECEVVAAIQNGDEMDLHYRIIRPDGTQRYLHSVGLIVRDPEGEALRLLGLAQDDTARVEADDARKQSEEMFSTLAEGVTDSFYVLDGEGRILGVNGEACRSTGYTREELLAMTVQDLELDHDQPMAQEAWRGVRPRIGLTFLGHHRRKDGSTFPVEARISCMEFHGRSVYLGMVRDISERVKAEDERRNLEAQVRHAEKLESLGSLASGVAHDMNNVLAAILAVGQVLRLKLEDDPGMISALDTIIKAAGRGRDLVKGLTNFARKDLRAAQPLDLNAIVRDEAALLDRTLRQKIRLEVDLDEPLPLFQGEPGNFGSALMNLCVNAVDAMPQGGTLTLRTRNLKNGWMELIVEDTGTGMTPEVMDRVFEPFFTTKEPGKGTGLGLAMVHGTMKSHGGILELQSHVGQGTSFHIRLPAIGVTPEEPGESLGASAPSKKSLKVLVVDDDELIQATVPLLLQHLGHQPTSAMCGEEGLEMLAQGFETDAVILDLNMPGLGGEATYLRIREKHPDLPILMATGFMDPSTDTLLQGDPRAGSLTKPFSIDELNRKLEAL